MKITRKEVEYVAHLARIELGPGQAEEFTGQLGEILGYFEKLEQLDTSQVRPTRHAIDVTNAFREDEVRPSYDADEALQNAPERSEGFFKVPKIIE
jgi:aspartyl-tRNA(Asn)/glutamyl-tRNA(Gln) amidotransferase subunit C